MHALNRGVLLAVGLAMIHWSPSRPAGSDRATDDGAGAYDEQPFAERVMSRVIAHLGDAIRQFRRHASLRATAFGWEATSIRTTEAVWRPCPHCQGAGMDRVSIPVPQDVFECPACHTVIADTRPLVDQPAPPIPVPVDLSTIDYDSWIIDDPRR